LAEGLGARHDHEFAQARAGHCLPVGFWQVLIASEPFDDLPRLVLDELGMRCDEQGQRWGAFLASVKIGRLTRFIPAKAAGVSIGPAPPMLPAAITRLGRP
jgi:hypothetical protein